MAMLAERKRKQKWSLNPRGNDWVQDSNKFGQKMLEKMGWQHGKGLGAKEDGITEHVKVSYKNDSKGMGYKESNDQWTEHETNFSALLESLTGEKPDEIKLNSLEKKSQSSRARVHYHKFTRGKDLSRYSEKDLANIFGKKTLKESSKAESTQENSDSSKEKKEDNKFLFNAGSMRDYFKKKLPSLGKSNGYVVGHNGVLKKEEWDSESNSRPSFSIKSDEKDDEVVSYAGFGFKSEFASDTNGDNESKLTNGKSTFVSYVNGNYSEESDEKKSKKKRKIEEKDVDNVFSPKKKSKKNKDASSKNSVNELTKGVANPAFNPLHTPVKVEKHVLDTIEESISEDLSELEDSALKYSVTTVEVHASPKKKKKEFLKSSCDSIEILDTTVEVKKKRKKSKEIENGIENCVFVENDSGEKIVVEMSSFEVKRKESKKNMQKSLVVSQNEEVKLKKKKKKEVIMAESNKIDLTHDVKQTELVYENPNFQETAEIVSDDIQIEENPYEVKPKKSKKKKQEKFIVDLTTDDSGISSIAEEASSKPKKKKKNDKTLALENPSFDSNLEDTIDLTETKENPYEVKVKKKKKRSKDGIDNVNFNETTEVDMNIPQTEENPFEVARHKNEKKKKNDYAIENPNFNESLEETDGVAVEENPYEVKPKKKKKKKDDALAIDNPNFNANDSVETSNENIALEVQKKQKKTKENKENIDSTTDISSSDIKESISLDIEDSDLMLNVVTTPIIKRTEQTTSENSIMQISSVKRRKSVRFSDVTQERIIPNNDDLRNLSDIENRNELFEINTQVINSSLEEHNISFDMSALDKFSYDNRKGGKKKNLGLDNAAFDKQKTNLEENLDSISKTIDRYQAEIENDMNEKKLETFTMEDIMIGEVGNPHGDHEKLPEGTKLKFRYANFLSHSPFYHLDKTGAKKAYKHLIKGDIVVGFKNSNLHEIRGYAVKSGASVSTEV